MIPPTHPPKSWVMYNHIHGTVLFWCGTQRQNVVFFFVFCVGSIDVIGPSLCVAKSQHSSGSVCNPEIPTKPSAQNSSMSYVKNYLKNALHTTTSALQYPHECTT